MILGEPQLGMPRFFSQPHLFLLTLLPLNFSQGNLLLSFASTEVRLFSIHQGMTLSPEGKRDDLSHLLQLHCFKNSGVPGALLLQSC